MLLPEYRRTIAELGKMSSRRGEEAVTKQCDKSLIEQLFAIVRCWRDARGEGIKRRGPFLRRPNERLRKREAFLTRN